MIIFSQAIFTQVPTNYPIVTYFKMLICPLKHHYSISEKDVDSASTNLLDASEAMGPLYQDVLLYCIGIARKIHKIIPGQYLNLEVLKLKLLAYLITYNNNYL